MRYGTIIARLLELAGQNAGGEFESLVKFHINLVYRRLLDLGKNPHETREFTLTTTSGTSQYGLPHYVRRVLNIEDPTNRRSIFGVTGRQYDVRYPGTDATGTPDQAYPLGVFGVEKQPSAAGVITLVSSDNGDSGTDYKVNVRGFSSGVLVDETVTMTGTTPVSTTTSFTTLERIVKVPISDSTLFDGDITVTDAAANTLTIIPTYWESPDHQWIEFYPIPDAAITYTVRAEMRKPPLVADSDWPEIAQEYHDLLVWGVTQDLFPKVGLESIADRHARTYQERMREYLSSIGENNLTILSTHVFADVLSRVAYRGGGRPGRPLILGVHV